MAPVHGVWWRRVGAAHLRCVRLMLFCALALHAAAQMENGSDPAPLVGRRASEVMATPADATGDTTVDLSMYLVPPAPPVAPPFPDLIILTDEEFPLNRAYCDTRDVACMVGLTRLAAEFMIMTEDEPYVESIAAGMENLVAAEEKRKKKFVPPDDLVIDYTGGIKLPPAPYTAPDFYLTEEGATSYVITEVTIKVLSTSFEPAHAIVQPGSSVTFLLETFETVHVRTTEAALQTNISFDSGPLNRNWKPSFTFRPMDTGLVYYENVALDPWDGRFGGSLTVSNYNCSSYTTCTSCLIYPQCIWCGGNGTCFERNATTNFPYDPGVVIAVPLVEVSVTKSYEQLRWMRGYNTRTVQFEDNWYPWPPIRKNNPKAEDPSRVPAYYTPLYSDNCFHFLSTRDASQCPDYKTPPPINRVHGRESPDRPKLVDFFACYEHVIQTWAAPDLPEPVRWKEWPAKEDEEDGADPGAHEGAGIMAKALCCNACASCDATLLNSCNITCPGGVNRTGLLPQNATQGGGNCPAGPVAAAIADACGRVTNCSSVGETANQCPLHNTTSVLTELSWRSDPETPVAQAASTERRLETEYVPMSSAEDAAEEAIRVAVAAAKSGQADWKAISTVAEAGMLEDLWSAKSTHTSHPRRLQEVVPDFQTLVPNAQYRLIAPLGRNEDPWAKIYVTMRELYGHRCNSTHGCDRVRGTCLNITGLPIIGYDQNGTCTCHPYPSRLDDFEGSELQAIVHGLRPPSSRWFTGDECEKPVVDDSACIGMTDDRVQCGRVRDKLYTCGAVTVADGMPPICWKNGLSVFECGQYGHLLGMNQDHTDPNGYVPNEIGRLEQGYAANTCAKCVSKGEMQPETYAKTCSRPEVLHACQRQEDATSQRICNYCSEDSQGSVLPMRGNLKKCSFFRGTCMGSVEKRIRGVVPPNIDIIGHNEYGGLRYCKRKAPFTMQQHYLTEGDIMQVGQSCFDHSAYFTNWDWTRKKFLEQGKTQPLPVPHPRTVRDALGLQCLDPNDEQRCPKSEQCVADLGVTKIGTAGCFENNRDWTKLSDIKAEWGEDKIEAYADQTIAVREGQLVLDPDEMILYTYNTHKKVLDPSTAGFQPAHSGGTWVTGEYLKNDAGALVRDEDGQRIFVPDPPCTPELLIEQAREDKGTCLVGANSEFQPLAQPLVMDPEGQSLHGNWPYLWPYMDRNYIEMYTQVTWSVDAQKAGTSDFLRE